MICNLSSLVFVFFLFGSSCYAISESEAKMICNSTSNPPFCSTLLSSNPNSSLVNLAHQTLVIANANVKNTIKLIHDLIAQSEKNPEAKGHYKSCLENFGADHGALYAIHSTQEFLHKGDYKGMNLAASGIMDSIEYCISGESPTDPRFDDPSVLPMFGAVINSVVDVLLVISNHLGH